MKDPEIVNLLKKILVQVLLWGDMLKSVYDTNANGVVDNSEKLDGNTLAQVWDHTPKAHKLDSHTDPDGILTTKGTLLKTGTQSEGRCHSAITAHAVNAGHQTTVCFREELTNIPSSITLSNVGTTVEVNLAGGYPQVMRISKFSFGFMIRAAAVGDALSGDKKFLTVGN